MLTGPVLTGPVPTQTTGRLRGPLDMPEGYWRYLALVGEVGLVLVACIGGGLLAGVLLDRWLHTGPVLSLVLLFAGIAAGFLQVYRLLVPKDKR